MANIHLPYRRASSGHARRRTTEQTLAVPAIPVLPANLLAAGTPHLLPPAALAVSQVISAASGTSLGDTSTSLREQERGLPAESGHTADLYNNGDVALRSTFYFCILLKECDLLDLCDL